MKLRPRRWTFVAASLTGFLFVAAFVLGSHLANERIEQHRLAQVQLGQTAILISQLYDLDQYLLHEGEMKREKVGAVDEIWRSVHGGLAEWEKSRPLGGSDQIAGVSDAAHQYLRLFREMVLLYQTGQSLEGRNLRQEQLLPAMVQLEAVIGQTSVVMERDAVAAHQRRAVISIGSAAFGAALFLFLLWRLDVVHTRSRRLEEEQSRRKSRDRYVQAMLRNVVGGVGIVDHGWQLRELSPGMERMFGYTSTQLLDVSLRDLLHPDDMTAYEETLGQLRATAGGEFHGEVRVLRADGTYGYAEVVATNLRHDSDIQGILLQARDVSDRKEAEEALRESEMRLRSTLGQLPAMLILVDREFRVLEASGASLRTLGLSPEEVVGKPLEALLGDSAKCQAYEGQFLRSLGGQAEERECHVRGRVLRTFTEPFRNREGEIVGVLSISLDITESAMAQQALQQQERISRLVSENAIELVALYQTDGRASYVSPASQPMLGYTPQEYMAMELTALIHPDDLERVVEVHRRAFTGEPVKVAFQIRKKDGQYAWFETLARPIRGDQGELMGIVTSSRDITERKRFEEQLAHVAYYDEQTGLPNRAAFVERLAERLQVGDGGRVGVIYIDLDNLKIINDSLGIEAGDLALNETARRLRESIAPQHFLARLGGDEFAILLDLTERSELPQDACEQLIDAFESPVPIGYREARISLIMGLSLGRAGESAPDDLMREANIALRQAAKQGTRYTIYHPSMIAGAMDRLELDADLRRAIRQGELQLHYQPIASLQNDTFIGVEALIRWRHPLRGWVPPSQFIPLAEQTGYIEHLGRWVLEEACSEARRWLERGVNQDSFSINVNLSAVQFQRGQIVEEIAGILTKTGLPANCLILEITETTLMRNPTGARTVLQRLKALGIKIAVDDFGTGHSSLSYLKQFPIDILKIDRSFVSGLGEDLVDRELARTVVGLARALNLLVTAEGVESPEQLAQLKEIGCDKAQGYYFARPAPADEVVLLLKTVQETGIH